MAKIACIGAGTVGSAWAAVFARAGHDVSLHDAQPDIVSNFALPRARQIIADLEASMPTGASADQAADRITDAPSIAAAVEGAYYVQESVREDVDIKRKAFAEIAQSASPDAILASSTSALPGSTFLTELAHPERALVAHPVNPPSHIPLVELCGSGITSQKTIDAAHELLTAAGMAPVVVKKEIEGFLLNRLQYTLVAEAMHLIGEGYCTAEDVDRVMTDGLALRWASIGPFMTAHLNAKDGFQGFVDQLGPMMRRMGAEAKTDYDWSPQQATEIHEWLCTHTPVKDIPKKQALRDRKILATRKMQADDAG